MDNFEISKEFKHTTGNKCINLIDIEIKDYYKI